MPETRKRPQLYCWTAGALAAVCWLGTACSGTEAGPRQGTPEWFFEAAKDNYAIGDYTKTVEQLKEAMAAEGEVGMEAGVWRFVLTGGLALGYDELVDAFVEGMEANDQLIDSFQTFINDYRRRVRINSIEFAEGIGPIKELVEAGGTVTLSVPLPEGNGSASPVLLSVAAGNPVAESQVAAMQDQTLTRGIYTALSTLTGDREYSKLAEEGAAGPIQATADQVAFGTARILLDISVMFDREGINDPKIRAHVLNMAAEWAEPHLEKEEFAEAAEAFNFDMTNEKRDMEGRRRIKKSDD